MSSKSFSLLSIYPGRSLSAYQPSSLSLISPRSKSPGSLSFPLNVDPPCPYNPICWGPAVTLKLVSPPIIALTPFNLKTESLLTLS